MPRSCRPSTFRSVSGKYTYIKTARRMIFGLVRMYRNGLRLVMSLNLPVGLTWLKSVYLTGPAAGIRISFCERATGLRHVAA